MVLNTIMAESVTHMANEIEKALRSGKSRQQAVQDVVQQVLKESQVSLFNGNGYSQEWVKEAERRKLFNLRTAPEAIQQLDSAKNRKVFNSTGVLSEKELSAHKEIFFENYCKALNVEAQCLLNMTSTGVLPAAINYSHTTHSAASAAKGLHGYATTISSLTEELVKRIDSLKQTIETSDKFDEHHLADKAVYFRKEVTDAMVRTREISDELETVVDDKLWPFPKYSEMLFMK